MYANTELMAPTAGWSWVERSLRIFLLLLSAMTMVSCRTMKPEDFAAQRPVLEIEKYYEGHTQSVGLIESRGGEPLKRVKTETWGTLKGRELVMKQDITMDNGDPVSRTWHIRRVDGHRYVATTDHMVGKATGEAWGNTLRLSYVLSLKPGNPLAKVRMTHWMQLQPDGRTLLNSVTVKKAGVVVGRISEVFRKEK